MHVSRIGLAALKGTRHHSLDEVRLELAGPIGDRTLCLVDPGAERVLRTIENPSLLAVRACRRDGGIEVRLPDGTVVRAAAEESGEELKADYWGRPAVLRLLDGPHAAILGAYLGREVRLAAVSPGEVVYGAAVTLVGASALQELAARAGEPALAHQDARFRSTFTVAGDTDLDGVPPGTRLRVGQAVVEVRGPVPRCAVVDLDPVTGVRTAPVMATLAGYRRREGQVWFGLDSVVTRPGTVRPGDPVSPLEEVSAED